MTLTEAPPTSMSQVAPYPVILQRLVADLTYKKGWHFYLAHEDRGQDSVGLTLNITITTPNTYHPEEVIRVRHLMIVPPAAYDERSWRRWLFDQILLVEQHEAAEFFQIGNTRPLAPLHGPGNSPYLICEFATDEERRTSFRGVVHDG